MGAPGWTPGQGVWHPLVECMCVNVGCTCHRLLISKGLAALLFATETFAMGVNMPARTVVFDSVKKHDGKELRSLQPAEYIQMAGRAGRRGFDKEGTVILLCKQFVPLKDDLKKMMLGYPKSLESQFRITYGMVLSLLRVQSLTVEGMMSRSFREAHNQKGMVFIQKELQDVQHQLEEMCSQQLSSYLQPLVKFYDSASSYLNARKEILPLVYPTMKVQKLLVPGRVLLITHQSHINKLGMLLTTVKSKQPTYKVLVLSDETASRDEKLKDDHWYQMIGLANDEVFSPIGTAGHTVLSVNCLDIFEISARSVKLNAELIIKDFDKRQMERFRDDPPGQTCVQAVQELQKLTMDARKSSNVLEYTHFINDLKVNHQNLYHKLKELYMLKDKLIDHLPSTQIPNFEQQFQTVFERKFLEEKKKHLEFRLSSASLHLYPDYENRIQLLTKFNYIDSQKRVQLKGRVACEMGMCELLITELVLRNILTKLQPAEVAALLSALVFRVKLREPVSEEDLKDLPRDLLMAIKEIKQIHSEIANLELSLSIHTEEFQEDLNFGLVRVVYEWASAKPFAEIMELTEVQEGIIVRCIQQLNETICDVRNAARIIGDPALQKKMEDASTAIKRDIVFAASLYTQKEAL